MTELDALNYLTALLRLVEPGEHTITGSYAEASVTQAWLHATPRSAVARAVDALGGLDAATDALGNHIPWMDRIAAHVHVAT